MIVNISQVLNTVLQYLIAYKQQVETWSDTIQNISDLFSLEVNFMLQSETAFLFQPLLNKIK